MPHPFYYVAMEISIEYIASKVSEYNKLMFGGELPPLDIRLSNARTFVGKLHYLKHRNLRGGWTCKDFQLIISTHFDVPEHVIEDTIIHEMIHYYIMYRQITDTSSHGEVFRDMMTRINTQFHRNVSISIRLPEESKDVEIRLNIVGISQLTEGRVGVTVAARTRLLEIWNHLEQRPDVISCTWYISTDPFFNKFPRSLTAKIYRITQEEVDKHLSYSSKLERHGQVVKLVPIDPKY